MLVVFISSDSEMFSIKTEILVKEMEKLHHRTKVLTC